MAGSYYVETLTNELIERARALIAEVDALGGSIAAIESGWMQARIAESAYTAQQAIERGEADRRRRQSLRRRHRRRVRLPCSASTTASSASRSSVWKRFAPRATPRAVERDARKTSAPRPAAARISCRLFVDAVDAGATLGEICDVLRDVFGTYRAREVVA